MSSLEKHFKKQFRRIFLVESVLLFFQLFSFGFVQDSPPLRDDSRTTLKPKGGAET